MLQLLHDFAISEYPMKKFGQSTLCTSSWLSGSGWLYLHMRGMRTRSAGPGSQRRQQSESTQQIYNQSIVN